MAKLALLNERAQPQDFKGAVDFAYPSPERPHPTVLPLGSFVHPRTKNDLMAGINLDLMKPGELERLKKTQKSIFNKRDLPNRYWTARRMNPDAMERAYRTYDLNKVGAVEPVRSTAKAATADLRDQPPAGTVDSFKPEQWAVTEPDMIDNKFVKDQVRNLKSTPQEVERQPAQPQQPAPTPMKPLSQLPAQQPKPEIRQFPEFVPPDAQDAVGSVQQPHTQPPVGQTVGNTVDDTSNYDAMEDELDQVYGDQDTPWQETPPMLNSPPPSRGSAPTVKPRIGPMAS